MTGKIDRNGMFEIQRKNKWKLQICPKRGGICGDTCPKFGEPYPTFITDNEGHRIEGWALRLCERDRLFFTELEDNRL